MLFLFRELTIIRPYSLIQKINGVTLSTFTKATQKRPRRESHGWALTCFCVYDFDNQQLCANIEYIRPQSSKLSTRLRLPRRHPNAHACSLFCTLCPSAQNEN